MSDAVIPTSFLIGMNGTLVTMLIGLVAYVFRKLDRRVEELSKAIVSLTVSMTERIARLES